MKKIAAEEEQRKSAEELVDRRTQELKSQNAELQSLNRELEQARIIDRPTGLHNRYYFDQQLQTLCKTMSEDSLSEHALLYIDLDHFKIINDKPMQSSCNCS